MVRVDYDTRAYWQGCAQKTLVIARCEACSRWLHPPKILCPQCWSTDIVHEPVSGKATVFTYTCIPQPDGAEDRVTIWARLDDADVIVMGELDPGYGSIACGDSLDLTWNTLEDTFVPGFRKRT